MPAVIVAAGFDWIEGLVGVLFVVVWIVSQIANLVRAARGAGNVAKPVARPRPPQPQAVPAADPREQLARQIEEFLRRSDPVKPQPQPQPAARKPAAVKERRPTGDRSAGERRTGDQRRQPPRRPPPPPAAPPSPPPQPVGTEVATHVREAFANEIAHLHSPLEAAGTNLAGTVTVPHPLVALLRDPATLRQLVLVREVLDRPQERW